MFMDVFDVVLYGVYAKILWDGDALLWQYNSDGPGSYGLKNIMLCEDLHNTAWWFFIIETLLFVPNSAFALYNMATVQRLCRCRAKRRRRSVSIRESISDDSLR